MSLENIIAQIDSEIGGWPTSVSPKNWVPQVLILRPGIARTIPATDYSS
jgi:hypothetical protein